MNTISKNSITPTMEDYLEAIYNLAKEKGAVRVRDIASKLNVKMPTVTNMLKSLSERGLIDYEKYEYLELTEKGSNVGQDIDRRHQIFRSFLNTILKIDYNQADEDACKMEHAVSPTTLDAFVDFVEFIENCPRSGTSWLDYFDEYRVHGQPKDTCLERMKQFAQEYDSKIKEMEKEKSEGEK
jgi:DtxR family transcriptional regulator, Mn-dependent transcriptional regulator